MIALGMILGMVITLVVTYQDVKDSKRYRWLRSSVRRVIDKDSLTAKMAFRYWCPIEELDSEIDKRI